MNRFDSTEPTTIKSNRFNTISSPAPSASNVKPIVPVTTRPNLAQLQSEAKAAQAEAKRANSPWGLFQETFNPATFGKATFNTAKDIGQGIARSVGTVGITAGNLPFQATGQPAPFQNEIQTTGSPITEALFGGKPIKTVQQQQADLQKTLEPYIGKTGSKYSALPLVLGGLAMDLSTFGGGKGIKPLVEGEIPEQFLKFLAKEKSATAIEDTLKRVGLDDINAQSLAPKLAETRNVNQVKDVLVNHQAPGVVTATESPANQGLFPTEVKPPTSVEPTPTTQPALFRENIPTPAEPPKPIFSGATEPAPTAVELATPLEKAQQQLTSATQQTGSSGLDSLDNIIQQHKTDVKNKVGLLDYLRTPENVLKKMGLQTHAVNLRSAYDSYLQELPKNIDQITKWSKEVPPESNNKIYDWLDGNKDVQLNPVETKVAGEIKTYLSNWADRLGLKPDQRISDYITHIFPPGKGGEINEELAKAIQYSVPGSVYDPFLLKRAGVEGFLHDTWKALDAYTKTATRKVHMDPVLTDLKSAASGLELSQMNFVKRYADRINMRPTELDTLIDNGIKSVAGYRFGVRPTKNLTATARKIVSRAKLGLSFTSAFKNLTQGINTFAELGTRYTTRGYVDLLTHGAQELKDNGVLLENFIEDRTYSAVKKFWEKADKVTFWNFQATELINRGVAYYGAKAKALAQGKTEQEAIQFGKDIAAKTQFLFGSIDTPVGLGSDIAKTLAQFQTFTLKQLEFLGEKVKGREYASLARYVAAGTIVFGTIGKAFGMNPWDVIPSLRFGTPPVLDLPVRLFKAVTGAKDQYGRTPSVGARLRDVKNAVITDTVPGGAQLNRTLGGLGAVMQGKSTTAAGNFQYRIPQTPENYIRGTLFGKSNLPAAQTYYNKKSAPKVKTNRFNAY